MVGAVIQFVVPGVPKGWQRTGQRIVSPKNGGDPFIVNFTKGNTRVEEAFIREAAYRAMNGRSPIDGPIEVRMMAYYPVPPSWSQKKQAAALRHEIYPAVKPDYDNIAKLLDGMKGVAWRDDSRVTDFHLWKRYSDRPRVIVEIRALTPGLPLLVIGDQ